MFIYKVDDDIELKPLGEEHGESLFALVEANRAYLREWLPWLDANTRVEHTREFIKSTRQQLAADNGFQAGIWCKNELCGIIGFHEINRANRNTGIGYWLAEKFTGRGIMTRSCRALIDYALKELKLHRVEMRCAEMNKRSRAIPERLGFSREGLIREAEWLYDHYVSHVVYSILANEWS